MAKPKKRLEKAGEKQKEFRYFISSLPEEIETMSRAVRGHWSIESMHWHLDVTFREDANTTIEKNSGTKSEYYQEMVSEYLKNGRSIYKDETVINEQETLCD